MNASRRRRASPSICNPPMLGPLIRSLFSFSFHMFCVFVYFLAAGKRRLWLSSSAHLHPSRPQVFCQWASAIGECVPSLVPHLLYSIHRPCRKSFNPWCICFPRLCRCKSSLRASKWGPWISPKCSSQSRCAPTSAPICSWVRSLSWSAPFTAMGMPSGPGRLQPHKCHMSQP